MARKRRAEYVSTAAAARRLGRSPDTIRRWIREGLLRGRQLRKPRGWLEVSVRSIERLENLATRTRQTQYTRHSR